MKVLADDASTYTLLCDCGRRFRARHPVLTFECPACGSAAFAADLLADWLLGATDKPPPMLESA